MITTEIRQVGNSKGSIWPQEMLTKMRVDKGDKIYATEVSGGYFISAYKDDVAEQLLAAEQIMHKYREAFRELSKK